MFNGQEGRNFRGSRGKGTQIFLSTKSREKNPAMTRGKLFNFSDLQFLHLQSCHEVES